MAYKVLSLRIADRKSVHLILILWQLIHVLVIMTVLSGIAQALSTTTPANPIQYLQRVRLGPRLREAVNKLGGRLEGPGKERLILNGILTRVDGSQVESNAFQLILEYPNCMRLEEQVGGHHQVLVFNGIEAANLNGLMGRKDNDLIETLVFDSIDHFLAGQMQGLSVRFLGPRFRLDDAFALDHDGAYYDIYQVTDRFKMGADSLEFRKLFYLNSNSQLLERVRYRSTQESGPVDVDIQILGWRMINGYYVPGSITRLENQQKIFSMTIDNANVVPRAEDSIFHGGNGN